MKEFHLTIRTPERDVFKGKVESLAFDSEGGHLEVLAQHASLSTTVLFTPVRVFDPGDNRDITFLARNGLFSFDNQKNEALLLCMYCEEQSEVSHQTVQDYLKFLTEELKKGELSDFQILFLEGEKLAVEKQMKLVK